MSCPGSLSAKNLDGIGADKSLFKLEKSVTVRDWCKTDGSLEGEGKDGTHNWQQAASGTLTDGGTNFVKVVAISWGLWCCCDGQKASILFSGLNDKNLRGAQSRSARPRTSVAQQTAVPVAPEQRGAWRSSKELVPGRAAAVAVVTPATAMMMLEKCMFWALERREKDLRRMEIWRRLLLQMVSGMK